jgi:MGT family glycosyltransferase
MMFGALAALEEEGTPTVVFVHSAPGALMPPRGVLETHLIGRVNEVRASAKRRSVDRLWAAWEPFPTFSNSVLALDPLAADLPQSFALLGPLIKRSATPDWHLPWPVGDARPLVLASFSTGPYWDQRSRIRRTLEALANRDYRALVTSSGADVGSTALPANVVVVNHLPHAIVMPHASIVVTHAGHGTVITSLAHGVPLLCLPNRAADQPALAAQINRLGVGRALDGDEATSEEIGIEVDRIVGDGAYVTAARRLATEIARAPGIVAAVRGLEAVAKGERIGAWSQYGQ